MRLFLIGLFTCFFTTISAQVSVTGSVFTAEGNPAVTANIVLLHKKDSLFVRGDMANDSGLYRLNNISAGVYRIQFSLVGYQTIDSIITISLADTVLQLATKVLLMEPTALNAIVIKSAKPLYQQKPGGLVVNVENNVMNKGSSALEVLASSPGVIIDQRNNSIGLNGKNAVSVLLNGKAMRISVEQLVNLLSGITANNIEKIELFSTPPAGYDAEGSGGVINIILKRSKTKGTTGTLSLTGGYGKYEKAAAGGSFQFANERMNIFASYTFNHNRTFSNMYLTSEQYMPFMGGDVFVTGFDTSKARRQGHDAGAGIDFYMSKNVTVGISSTFNSSSNNNNNVMHAGYTIYPDSLLTYAGYSKGSNKWNNYLNTVYMDFKLENGQKLNVDLDYLVFKNKAASVAQNNFIDKHGNKPGTDEILFGPRQQTAANTSIRVWALKADYVNPVSEKWNLESGIKTAFTRSHSTSGIESWVDGGWRTSDQVSNNMLMQEWIVAAYSSLSGKLSSTWSVVAGLRYEHSNTYMNHLLTGAFITRRKLGRFFPNLLFSKNNGNGKEWQFSYTQRITRPSYNDLASFVAYSDPTAVYTGNPFLQPGITHNLKVGYLHKRYALSLLFSRDVNAISRYQLLESRAKDMLLITPQNLPRQDYISLQASVPVTVNGWWRMNYNWVGGLRNFRVSHTRQAFNKTYFAYSFNFNQAFTLPKGFSAELSGWYNTRSYDASKRLAGFFMLNAGVKKQLRGNAVIQLAVADILQQERYIIRYGTLSQEAFDIRSKVNVNVESIQMLVFKLTYSRSFGGASTTKAKQRINTREEAERVIKN